MNSVLARGAASTISGVLFGFLLDATGRFALLWTAAFVIVIGGMFPALKLRRLLD